MGPSPYLTPTTQDEPESKDMIQVGLKQEERNKRLTEEEIEPKEATYVPHVRKQGNTGLNDRQELPTGDKIGKQNSYGSEQIMVGLGGNKERLTMVQTVIILNIVQLTPISKEKK